MSDTDIEQVRLNIGRILRRCKNCGCVTESWRDKVGDRQYRRIGQYDSCASPNRFTIAQSVLDEYLCQQKSGRLASYAADPNFQRQTKLAEEIMRKDREVLQRLSKQ